MGTKTLFASLLIFVIMTGSAWPQNNRSFSEDPDIYTSELRDFMGRNLSGEQNTRLEHFIRLWDSAAFARPEKEFIITTSGMLRSRNARPVPHMYTFIETIILFSDYDLANFRIWQQAFSGMAGSDNVALSAINEFLVSSGWFISESRLFRSGALSWKATSKDYRLVYDDTLRILFGNTDLMAFNHIDTMRISGTGGVYYPREKVWKGTGGRVTWERAGLDAEEAMAMLGPYTIDLSRSEYTADSASFRYNRYLSTPMSGRLTDRLMTTSNRDDAGYPRFVSHRQELVINGIYSGVDYEGGLSMRGARLIGSGSETENARVHFHYNGERWLTAESLSFVFRPQGMTSVSASILFFIENDSVFHPDMQINYIDNSRELSVSQNQKIISQSPWYNHFHQVDMSFSQLIWNIDSPEVVFTMPRAGSLGNASFRSASYFDRNEFLQLQGMEQRHPLANLRSFGTSYGYEDIPAEEYARFLRRPLPQVRRHLLDLSRQGFIYYDTETDIVRVRERLNHYLQANARRIDYDIISFESRTRAPVDNAILDLTNNDLKINGIPRVSISNTKNVDILPLNSTLTLKRHRNFNFDGTINAGNLSFFGTNYAFDYAGYSINLQNVDSIRLRAWLDERDEYGRFLLTEVYNIIRNVTGELVIDRPFNKSGRVDMPEYPRFTSAGNSYVFFEDPEIHAGVYKSDHFYFELEPFQMDSLNTYRNENMRFSGKLVSAGIFPDLEGQLSLQEDYSLGMNYSTRREGISAYGNKGTFYNDIHLSKRGLEGMGRLEYLTAEIRSPGFIFFPDSMSVQADEFRITRQTAGIEFPDVRSSGNSITWQPYEDVMAIGPVDSGFSFFDDRAQFDGQLLLGSGGLEGAGMIDIQNARISSDEFDFSSESFSADTSNLELQMTGRPVSIAAEKISSRVDLRSGSGQFRISPETEMVSLPLSGYVSNPVSMEWNMAGQRFDLLSGQTCPESGRRGARYISTVRGQDSLDFYSPHAVMDYRNELLHAGGVEYLEVADATIYPAEESLVIGEGGRIFPLRNGSISASRENLYHDIYNATVQIEGKYSYSGSGYYDYRDERDNIHTILFDTIFVDSDTVTVATGHIRYGDDFMLSPRFEYTGTAGLNASRRFLNFSGSTRILHDCSRLGDQRISFSNIIDPVEVLIPVTEQTLSPERERIYSGIFVATDSVHIYPAFFTSRRSWSDQLIITANGYMKYDINQGEYVITSLERHKDPAAMAKILRLDPEGCIIHGEGPLELGVDLGQLKINMTGHARNEVEPNETTLEGVLTMDFFLSGEALALISKAADSIAGEPVDPKSYYYERGLRWILGDEKAGSLTNNGNNKRTGRTDRKPADLNNTFVLSHINLVWNKESRSYRSHGPIGIASIGGMPVNKFFNGYLEITKRRSGDMADFYIEFDDRNWYYFGYTRGTMQTFSSNSDYVTIIRETPLRHRRMSVSARETRFIYMLATDTRMEQFFRVYRQHLEGETMFIPDDEIEIPDEEIDPDEEIEIPEEKTEEEPL